MKKIIKLLGLFVVAVALWGVWRMMSNNVPSHAKPAKNEPFVAEPVVYDVSSWAISPKSRETKTLMAHLGVATADDAMDFYGNPATRYRYTAHHEAPLYVVMGQDVMEVVWYHASPKDDVAFKEQSQNHAQKVHALATAIYGTDGKTLMQAVLSEKPAPKLTGLIEAGCQAYQCRLIINTKKLGITTTKA